jgi:hypothetical protein
MNASVACVLRSYWVPKSIILMRDETKCECQGNVIIKGKLPRECKKLKLEGQLLKQESVRCPRCLPNR